MSISRQQLEEKFQSEYNRLNPAQQQAVDTIEGPVMVIAGPGTGKTQILASRIGKILLDTDSQPENILCLTYTDAGVLAMRRRLLQFIGPAAYKVNLYTFHAFCNDVIQENLGYFRKNSLDPISDLQRVELLRKLIEGFTRENPLKRYRGDVYYEINNLSQLFSSMKREGWTPAFLVKKIDEYLDEIENNDQDNQFHYKTSRKGQWQAGDAKPSLQEEKERMEKLKAAVREFDHYQELMRDAGLYDFDDMINWVIRAFEEDKNLLARYQEQFLYILVDEYQDTSGTQNRLVELLISYWDKPNVFVVGDDDQSIYRFQGANVENMLSFNHAYEKDLLRIVLTRNYRSTQPILDVSKSLIENNTGRLIRKIPHLSKDLLASNVAVRDLRHQPRIVEYETARHELIGITLEVKKLLAQGIPAGNIAVIYKENRYGEDLARYFSLQQIPSYSKRNLNLLDIPLGKKLILLLRYLAAEHDAPYGGDEMLFEILHFDWFGIPPMEIAKLSMEVAGKQFSADPSSMRRMIYEKSAQPAKDLFSSSLHPRMKEAGQVLEKLIAAVPNLTLQGLLEKMIREAGILKHIMQSPDKLDDLQVLNGFFDFVKEETRRNPLMDIHEIVQVIDLMEKEGIPLPLVRINGSDKAVNLLTAHGSKGLEFQYVFLAGCNASFWEKKRKPGGGFRLPNTVFDQDHKQGAANTQHKMAGLPTKQVEEEELRRLFYVALTRAEQHLILSYSRFRNDGKEQEPSMFLAEILDQHQLPVEKAALSESELAEFDALRFGEECRPEIEKMEEAFLDRILEKFVLSVTALNNYLRCPLEFYFNNLVRIPSPKNEATEFGSAVHYALEQLFRKMQEDPGNHFPGKEVFLSDFEWYMHRHRESFTAEQFARRMEYGKEVLGNYYDHKIDSFNKIVAIERSIRQVVYRGVPLKGKLDKLEFDGRSVNVVDYKTGDPDKGREKMRGPSDKNPLGGDYWRQAVFYKILVDNYSAKDWQALSTEFDFVEPDKKKNYRKEKLLISPADIETVGRQITDTWEKIQKRDFYTGCGDPDCHWCNFVKTNNLAIALHELQTEEEDPQEG